MKHVFLILLAVQLTLAALPCLSQGKGSAILQQETERAEARLLALRTKLESVSAAAEDTLLSEERQLVLMDEAEELRRAETELEEALLEAKKAAEQHLSGHRAKALAEALRTAGEVRTEVLFPGLRLPTAPAVPDPQSQTYQMASGAVKDLFSGHGKELAEASRELDRYRGRYESVQHMRDTPIGLFGRNPLRDKPWQERVVIGAIWQPGRQEMSYTLDLGPSLAWRWTDRVSTGLGFQYRLSVNVKSRPWALSGEKVLGYFAFADVEVKKGFFARLHFEDLNAEAPRPDAAGQNETIAREWVKGLSVGAGKSYGFYKRINGYALVQYNLLRRPGETPYLQPLQARLGFYLFANALQKGKPAPVAQ